MATYERACTDRMEIAITAEDGTKTIYTRIGGRVLKLTHVEEALQPKVTKTLEHYASQVSPNIHHLHAALFHLGVVRDDKPLRRSKKSMRVMTGEPQYAGMGSQEMFVVIDKTPYILTYPNTLGRIVRETLQKIRREDATIEELHIGGVYVREVPPQLG